MVRNNDYKRAGLSLRERHNERKNEAYANPDIVQERSRYNIHFKQPKENYTQAFDRLVSEGTIITRSLKPDADVVCEFVFDVNTAYFEEHGGYPFAKSFFEEAYRMAVKEVGDERYILSAVMHADERNKQLSETLGHDVYHYHMHVVYVPVVEKEILWSKRCKDEQLRGTVKEIIHQVSRSKKWAYPQALDANGQPVLNKKGKPVRIPSYSLLQDRFYTHMKEAGFSDIERGERGSNVQHLSVLDFKIQKDTKTLERIDEQVAKKQKTLDALSDKVKQRRIVSKTFQELDSAGRKTLFGKIELPEKEYQDMLASAKEGILSR